jgi:hypothetical protein
VCVFPQCAHIHNILLLLRSPAAATARMVRHENLRQSVISYNIILCTYTRGPRRSSPFKFNTRRHARHYLIEYFDFDFLPSIHSGHGLTSAVVRVDVNVYTHTQYIGTQFIYKSVYRSTISVTTIYLYNIAVHTGTTIIVTCIEDEMYRTTRTAETQYLVIFCLQTISYDTHACYNNLTASRII